MRNEVRVIRDAEFIKETDIRKNDYWKTIELIQTSIKSATGCGKPISIHFFAPMDEKNANAEIKYSTNHLPSDYELIV